MRTVINEAVGIGAGDATRRAGVAPSARSLVRLILLLALLAAELVVLTPPIDTEALERAHFWFFLWDKALHQIRPALVTGILAAVFFSWDVLRDEFDKATDNSRQSTNRDAWLTAHLLIVAALFTAKALKDSRPVSLLEAEIWLSVWVAMALPVFVTWADAVFPPQFWIGWFNRSRGAFIAGIAFGGVADFLAGSTGSLWWPLQRLSFEMVAALLRLTGHTVASDPQRFVIGTPKFNVQIWAQCSGFEGIGLIVAFLVGYLWLYRKELRFPHALLLLPIGAVAIWLTNAVRIAALILIGGWDPGVGFKGFHSVAGWLFFNMVACGLIWTSWRFNLFAKTSFQPAESHVSNPAGIFLMPLLAIITVSMITTAFSEGFEFLYPLRVVAAVAVFWVYRRDLAARRWDISYFAVGLGVLVFGLWIALSHINAATQASMGVALRGMSVYATTGWVLCRVVGSVITVPLAEELAFRGYVIRKLVSYDLLAVRPGQFTWFSFFGSSILFGALHGEWLAGTLAGMAFAVALYRRGQLCDAVSAHATANGLLSAYVLLTASWSLWT